MQKLECLIIDPQNSFCDPQGELYVKGAENDMTRLAKMIDRLRDKISQIRITLDSHHLVDVAHPAFWKNSKGEHPTPFTIITSKDVKDGVWKPFKPSLNQRMIEYTETLEKNGKFLLCIWPPHCLIGSPGHCVFHVLYDAVTEWENSRTRIVDYVTKVSNIYTEHFSAIRSEVPDPNDESTQVNTRLIKALIEADSILIGGEAGSHCLKNSVEDIVTFMGNDDYIKKLVLLTDATSPVSPIPGADFPAIQDQFIKDMVKRGMRVSTTTEFLA